MKEPGYITRRPISTQAGPSGARRRPRRGRARAAPFEVTDKALDFLGYRALRDLLGIARQEQLRPARHARPRHRHRGQRRAEAIRVRRHAQPRRDGDDPERRPARPVGAGDVEYEDLMVAQGEYQSSCATVLMLDCSHSMILYGEDRFTPAKRVALALAHLIRHAVSGRHAARGALPRLGRGGPARASSARVRVGPYYTNTREGLRLARRLLERQRKDMRQIVMITDGKPSALTRPDGRIYKNAVRPRPVRDRARRSPRCPPARRPAS